MPLDLRHAASWPRLFANRVDFGSARTADDTVASWSKGMLGGTPKQWLHDVGIALMAAVGASCARLLLDRALGDYGPYSVFYAGVVFSAWKGGFRAAALALVLGFGFATFFFVPPRYSLSIDKLEHQVHAGVYCAVGTAIALMGGVMQRAQVRAQGLAKRAVAKQEQLEQEIVERERAVKSLIEAQQTLQTLLDHVPEGVTLVGGPPDYRILANSRFAVDLLGQDIDQTIGLPAGYHAKVFGIRLADGVTVPKPEQMPLYRATRFGESIMGEEWVIIRADGTRMTTLFNVVPIRDEHQKIIGAINCWRDISERKQMEEALRDADRRKDEFLAVLSHELRNPLSSILASVHVLNRIAPAIPAARERREAIERRVVHMSRLVDELLDASRLALGKVTLQPRRLDLVELVRLAADDYRHLFDERQIVFSLNVPANPLWIDGDIDRLAQSIGNLLHNAAKYTPSGGQVTLTISLASDETAVAIKVADNGIGMAPELIESAFQSFSRLHQTGGKDRGGLGLGLSVVRQLVEMHGGRVTASSPGPGQGSTFTIQLPYQAGLAPTPSQVVSSESHARSASVLVIEDDPEVVASLCMLLRVSGHQVYSATNGRQGLDQALQLRPDLILCDIHMPGELDGYAVARAIRREPSLDKTHLVALTGFGQASDREGAVAAGFDRHITKPVSDAQLDALLSEIVGAETTGSQAGHAGT